MSKKRERRDYQKEGVQYAVDVGDPAFFVQMRLGKTLMAIDACNEWKAERILVVAPTSALYSWEDELELEGETDYCYLTGKASKRRELLEHGEFKWWLLNKEGHLAFHSTEQHGRRTVHLWDKLFTDYPWDVVILDESTFVRYPKTTVSKCYTKNFRDVPHRMILSGLPNPEGLMDFFQQFLFLDGGETLRKNNYWQFLHRHFVPTDRYHFVPRAKSKKWIEEQVAKRAFTKRRKDIKLENPMAFERRFAILPAKLRRTYEKVEKEFLLEYEGREINRTVYKIAVYTWLRHVASGFVDGELVWTGKVDLLLELLAGELKGEPMVVWFDYNEGLFACRRWLLASGYSVRSHVGSPVMSKARRKISYKDWRAGRAQILLAQPRTLQYGADLSRASVQIFFTSPLSNELREQAIERIWKAKSKRPLLCLDFTTRDTIDEDIYRLLHKKRRSAVRLLEACSEARERRQKHG